MATPLKLRDSDGNLQEISSAEENYLAYHAGLYLAAMDSSDPSALSLDSSGSDLIGQFTNTFFDNPVGSHGGGNLSVGTTVTNLYQKQGLANENNSNFRRPVGWNDSDSNLFEFPDAEFNPLVDRLVETIFTNEYPGCYRLASAAPSGDWDVHIDDVFTDTQTDGTSVVYNIYQRQTMTAPTPQGATVGIKRASGNTGAYQGIQEMGAAQMQAGYGLRAMTRIIVTGVGEYQLRSASAGAPVDSGTWSARGVATDTRKTTASADYTRVSTVDSTSDSTVDYTGDFIGNYIANVTYTRDSTVNYTGEYTGDFTGDFVTAINYQRTSTRDSTSAFIGDFIGDFVGTVVAPVNYTRTSTAVFTGDFQGNYTGETGYTRTSTNTFTGDFIGVGDYIGQVSYVGDFLGAGGEPYIRFRQESVNYVGPKNYVRDSTGYFVGNFLGPANYLRNSTSAFTGNFIGNYTGLAFYPTNYQRNSTNTFTGNFIGNYTGDFIVSVNYTRNSTSLFTGDYVANYIGNYVVSDDFTRNSTSVFTGNYLGNYISEYTGNYIGETIQPTSETIETYTLYVRTAA